MDSLLASYASDEDDGDQSPSAPTQPLPSPSPSLFSSLAPPKNKSSSSTSSSLFSVLPPPKFGKSVKAGEVDPPVAYNSNSSKKVVFLKQTWGSSDLGSDDDDEEEEKMAKARKNQFANVSGSSTLSLPAPKYSFGAAPSSSGRRALIETSTAAAATVAPAVVVEKVETVNYGEKSASLCVDAADAATYGYYPVDGSAETADSSGVPGAAAVDYGYYAVDGSADYYPDVGGDGYGGGYAQHGGDWGEGGVVDSAPAADFVFEDGRRGKGKRGRNEVPVEVMEVKQDELMKNRPREDQSKMTGIAFGPGYQPVSSAKGKPNKLHKRKHQIGSLYFDMKQKEMELAERRSRGFQTKAETQGKYGW